MIWEHFSEFLCSFSTHYCITFIVILDMKVYKLLKWRRAAICNLAKHVGIYRRKRFWKHRDSKIAWPSGLRRWFKAPVTSVAWVRIPPLSNLFSLEKEIAKQYEKSLFWDPTGKSENPGIRNIPYSKNRSCAVFLLQLGIFYTHFQGSVAEWSKALVLGTSHFGGVGSNPTTIISLF